MITGTEFLLLCFGGTFKDTFYLLNKSARLHCFPQCRWAAVRKICTRVLRANFLKEGLSGEDWMAQINICQVRQLYDHFFSMLLFPSIFLRNRWTDLYHMDVSRLEVSQSTSLSLLCCFIFLPAHLSFLSHPIFLHFLLHSLFPFIYPIFLHTWCHLQDKYLPNIS